MIIQFRIVVEYLTFRASSERCALTKEGHQHPYTFHCQQHNSLQQLLNNSLVLYYILYNYSILYYILL